MIARFMEWRRQNKIRALARSIWRGRGYSFTGIETSYAYVKRVMALLK